MNLKEVLIFYLSFICLSGSRAQIKNESSELNLNSTSVEVVETDVSASAELNTNTPENSTEILNEISLERNDTDTSSELIQTEVTTQAFDSTTSTSTILTEQIETSSTIQPILSEISTTTINPSTTPIASTENIFEEFNPDKDIHFRLYNTQTYCQNVPEIILNSKESILSSNFNPTLPTRFLIHDWDSYSKTEFTIMVKEAYLSNSNHNIIIVDWEKAALTPYLQAQNHSLQVGQMIGKFIDFLNKDGNLNVSDVYLIGFGLGAHIAGIAGRSIKNDKRISVIYGLDPIQLRTRIFINPTKLHAQWHMRNLLQKSDAKYVEIIYTSQMTAILQEPAGHANFYVNLGTNQPGCDLNLSCGHARAYRYFAESIVSRKEFIGIPCRNYREIILGGICRHTQNPLGIMGGKVANRYNSGVFYVPVQSRPPHAIGIF